MVTYFAVDSDGTEVCFNEEPIRKCENGFNMWTTPEGIYYDQNNVCLPRGTIKLITGKDLTWEDEFIMIKDKL